VRKVVRFDSCDWARADFTYRPTWWPQNWHTFVRLNGPVLCRVER